MTRKDRFVLSILSWMMVCSAGWAQTPILESGEDCVDWFTTSWASFEKRHAVVGHAESSYASGAGHVEIDWFQIKCIDNATKANLCYCESRVVYSDAPDSGLGGIWIKTLSGLKKPLWSAGEFSAPLETREPPVFNDKGKLILGSARTEFPPCAFSMSVMTGSGFQMCDKYRSDYFAKTFGEMTKVEEPDDSHGNKVVFMFNNVQSREFVGDPKNGRPVITRGYFLDKSKKGKPDRSFFPVLNYESRTTWECVDEKGEVYAPATVDNFVHRAHPLHKTSMHVRVATAYSVEGIGMELLSDENMASYLQNKGRTAELRAELAEKVSKRKFEIIR